MAMEPEDPGLVAHYHTWAKHFTLGISTASPPCQMSRPSCVRHRTVVQMIVGGNTVCHRHDVTGDPVVLSYKWASQALKTIYAVQNTQCLRSSTFYTRSGRHNNTLTWPLHGKGLRCQGAIDNRPNRNADSFVVLKEKDDKRSREEPLFLRVRLKGRVLQKEAAKVESQVWL